MSGYGWFHTEPKLSFTDCFSCLLFPQGSSAFAYEEPIARVPTQICSPPQKNPKTTKAFSSMLMMLRVGQNVIGWKGVAAPRMEERKWHLKQHESHRQ